MYRPDLAGPKERYSFFGGYCDLQTHPRDDLALAAVVLNSRERTARRATHQEFRAPGADRIVTAAACGGSRGLSSGSWAGRRCRSTSPGGRDLVASELTPSGHGQ